MKKDEADTQPTKSKIKSSSIPPMIGDTVLWENVKVDFNFILLNACLITGRQNLRELYSGTSKLKWSRAFAIEWLEKNIEGATSWNRNTLNDRFVKAEKMARRVKMTKTMSSTSP